MLIWPILLQFKYQVIWDQIRIINHVILRINQVKLFLLHLEVNEFQVHKLDHQLLIFQFELQLQNILFLLKHLLKQLPKIKYHLLKHLQPLLLLKLLLKLQLHLIYFFLCIMMINLLILQKLLQLKHSQE